MRNNLRIKIKLLRMGNAYIAYNQDEAYSFSVTSPHLNSIDECYNGENLIYYSSGRASRCGSNSNSSRFRDGMATLSSCDGSGSDDDYTAGNGGDGDDNNNNNNGSKDGFIHHPIDEDDPYSSIDWANHHQTSNTSRIGNNNNNRINNGLNNLNNLENFIQIY
ncbi:hypothetical protein Glove_365g195 [Diversispora epigaea]|uniref:Uncharacterized protein n=1 Tax=Diversispora epigaea TaxID=1348612 RepID=A0A397H7Q3_9GLOM|nr:hypothetical protein Glove_365g195 [Diversispora epigaea]